MPIKRSKQAKNLRKVVKRKIATHLVGGEESRARTTLRADAQDEGAKRPKQAKTPTKQGDFEVGNKKPPKNRQFGQPEGNPRHNGAWKKEDTLRFKLQQVAKLDKDELYALLDDKEAGEYEKSVARILLDIAEPQNQLTAEERWRILNGLTNQDSGMPKQQVDQTNYEAPIPLSPRQIITEPRTKATRATKKTTKKKK